MVIMSPTTSIKYKQHNGVGKGPGQEPDNKHDLRGNTIAESRLPNQSPSSSNLQVESEAIYGVTVKEESSNRQSEKRENQGNRVKRVD